MLIEVYPQSTMVVLEVNPAFMISFTVYGYHMIDDMYCNGLTRISARSDVRVSLFVPVVPSVP